MFDFTKYIPMLQSGLEKLEHCLGHIYTEVRGSREASQAQARIMAFEFGVVDQADSEVISPRRLSQLPVIDQTPRGSAGSTSRKEIDVQGMNQGRAVSRGFYANLGDAEFDVILVGISGQTTIAHTLPPGTTIQLSSLISKVIIDPVPDGPARYQLYVY